MFSNLCDSSYKTLSVLNIKVCFPCGEWNLYQNLKNPKILCTRFVVFNVSSGKKKWLLYFISQSMIFWTHHCVKYSKVLDSISSLRLTFLAKYMNMWCAAGMQHCTKNGDLFTYFKEIFKRKRFCFCSSEGIYLFKVKLKATA